MKVLLFGAAGKLGGFLHRDWMARHEVEPVTRAEVDLEDRVGLRALLEASTCDAVINCAAMASPEACEAEPGRAESVNALAPEVMATVCRERGLPFVHFSTDYVVDGRDPGLKDESAATDGGACYGRSKLAGERRVLEACPTALVCRVSWVFGEGLPSFLDSVVDRALRGEMVEAVADKWSKPTSAMDISRSVEKLIRCPEASGVLHLVSEGEPESWWSYAQKALVLARDAGVLSVVPEVRQSTLAAVPQLSAPRPRHTALRSGRLAGLLGEALPAWEDRAAEHLRSRE
jgi:dTDP-4-dehydrorhamnose reductase